MMRERNAAGAEDSLGRVAERLIAFLPAESVMKAERAIDEAIEMNSAGVTAEDVLDIVAKAALGWPEK